MELYQITQFLAFAQTGNVSKAAQNVNTSQPALSRALKRLEEDLGVPLFARTKNTIALNKYGQLAVQYAKEIESSVETVERVLRETYKLEHCIQIATVAPAPLWDIEPLLKKLYPQKGISSFLGGSAEIEDKLKNGDAQLAILGAPVNGKNYVCKKWGEERLYFSAPKGHKLEKKKSVTFKDIAGETMLLFSDIGFWHEVHQNFMPNSRFLLQKSRDDFSTLVNSSQLPSFSSDIVIQKNREIPGGAVSDRTDIPISDKSAHATYYAVCSKKNYADLREFFESIK
ncbi:MAG: LysR family transcriptional regulator [Treponema sp.]|nr:LysR family transcriptional regulator [Treponema sp.]